MTAPPPDPAEPPRLARPGWLRAAASRRLLVPGGVIVVVAALAVWGLLTWDNWWVNHDGTFYLALAHNLKEGAGYRFPDGSVATFRGPTYPGMIALGWLVLDESARSAIWVTRSVFVLVPVLVALITMRMTADWRAAALGGAMAAVQPVMLISGALFFVPDGLVVALVLGAVLLVVWSVPSLPSRTMLVAAGVLLGIGFLAKESAAVGLLVPVAWAVAHPDGGFEEAVDTGLALLAGWLLPVVPWVVYARSATGSVPGFLSRVPSTWLWALVGVVAVRVVVGLVRRRVPALPRGRLAGWLTALGVVVASYGLFVVAADKPVFSVPASLMSSFDHIRTAIPADLATQLYRKTPWGWLRFALLAALAWGWFRIRRPVVLFAMILVGAGFGTLMYTAQARTGLRTASLLAYAVVLLGALMVADLWTVKRWRWLFRSFVVVVVATSAWASLLASAETNERLAGEELTAESSATVAAAAWLAEHAEGETVVGTPLYFQSIWRLAGGEVAAYLLPTYMVSRDRWDAGEVPSRIRDWAGTRSVGEPTGPGIAFTINRAEVGAFYRDPIVEFLTERSARYLVVTGNSEFNASAMDAGGLLRALEASPGFVAVFRSPRHVPEWDRGLPQWVVIYRVEDPSSLVAIDPVVHLATNAPVPDLSPRQVVLDSPSYKQMVRRLVAGDPAG